MKTQTKVFIGLGIASAIGIGAFLYSRSKKAEPKLTADVVTPAEPVLDTKKELTQSDANALAQKVFEIKNMEMSSKFSKGYNSPATALLQQLKDADYTYVKKVNPTKTGSFEYGAAIKNGSKEAKDIPVQKRDRGEGIGDGTDGHGNDAVTGLPIVRNEVPKFKNAGVNTSMFLAMQKSPMREIEKTFTIRTINGMRCIAAMLMLNGGYDESGIKKLGAIIGTKAGSVITAHIPLGQLKKILSNPSVKYLEVDSNSGISIK